MISPRLNFSLIKAKFCELAPAIDKRANRRQRRADIIRLVSVRAGMSASMLVRKVDSRSFFSSHGFNHPFSCRAHRFWNSPPGVNLDQTRSTTTLMSSNHIPSSLLSSILRQKEQKDPKTFQYRPEPKTGWTGTVRQVVCGRMCIIKMPVVFFPPS